jgi:hypothetical protein
MIEEILDAMDFKIFIISINLTVIALLLFVRVMQESGK